MTVGKIENGFVKHRLNCLLISDPMCLPDLPIILVQACFVYPDLIAFNQIVSVSLSFFRTLRFKFRETTESFTACVAGARKERGEGKSDARATREGSEGEGKGGSTSLPKRVARVSDSPSPFLFLTQ